MITCSSLLLPRIASRILLLSPLRVHPHRSRGRAISPRNPPAHRVRRDAQAEAGDEANIVVEAMLRQRFGQVDREGDAVSGRLRMVVDGSQVIVDVNKGSVECVEGTVQKRVEGILKRILGCLYPVGAPCPCE